MHRDISVVDLGLEKPLSSYPHPWLRIENENASWYGRFTKYLCLGGNRSIAAVYRMEKGLIGDEQPNGHWTTMAKKNRWIERAGLYDAFTGQQLLEKTRSLDEQLHFHYKSAVLNMAKVLHEFTKLADGIERIDVYQKVCALNEVVGFNRLAAEVTAGYKAIKEHKGQTIQMVMIEGKQTNPLILEHNGRSNET